MRRTIPQKLRYATVGVGVALVYLFAPLLGVGAQGVSSIAQGFTSENANVKPGALVSLKEGESHAVELATTENMDQLAGVVGEDALIELNNGSSPIQVVTTGVANALVSDINGDIKIGDKITASPLSGIGMKATQSGVIVGTAQADLSKVTTKSTTATDKTGKQQVVSVGTIPIQVDVIFYTGLTEDSQFVPAIFQEFANQIAGKQVSPLRVLSAALLILLLIIVIAAVLYSAVRSSIISIGRNPLSGPSVRHSLFQIGLTVFGLLGFTVILVYLILTF